MSAAPSHDLEDLLLRMVSDAAMLHVLLQEAHGSDWRHIEKRLSMLLTIIDALPAGPTSEGAQHAVSLGFRSSPSRFEPPSK